MFVTIRWEPRRTQVKLNLSKGRLRQVGSKHPQSIENNPQTQIKISEQLRDRSKGRSKPISEGLRWSKP